MGLWELCLTRACRQLLEPCHLTDGCADVLMVALPADVVHWSLLPRGCHPCLAGQPPAAQGRGAGSRPALPLRQKKPPWPPGSPAGHEAGAAA